MLLKKFHKQSLTGQFLTLYLVTTVLVMVAFIAITYINSNYTMMEIGTQNTQSITDSSAIHLSAMVDDIEYQFFLMQNNNELQYLLSDSCTYSAEEQVDKITNILSIYDVFRRKVEKFEIYSLTKDYYPSVASSGKNVFKSSELLNDVWFKEMLASNYKPVFHTDDINSTPYITASRLIADTRTREPIAIAKAYINANMFYSLIKDIRLMQNGKMFITTNTHIINPFQDKAIDSFANNTDIYNKIIPNQIQSSVIHMPDSEYRIFCYPIQNTGLYLIAFVATSEFDMLGRSMLISTLTASLLLMLFVFLIQFFISLSFIKPIKMLSNDMSRFDDENSIIPVVPPGDTAVEITSLYHSYGKMCETIKELLDNIKNQSRLQRETEFRVLQAQIKPHFLYNTLGSISALADEINAEEIRRLAASLSTYFRTSLNNGKELITVRQELEQAMSYAEIQKIRYPDRFELKMDINENILDYQICKLVLQPLIENCITHAFNGMTRLGIITVRGDFDDDDIILSVSDNGYGLNYVSVDALNSYANAVVDNEQFSTMNHFGIYNISQRIRLYYGVDYGLEYSENEEGGITATIHLPKKSTLNF